MGAQGHGTGNLLSILIEMSHERNQIWSVVVKKTWYPAIAAMTPARAKAFAVNASATTSKAGSCPDAAFPPQRKKPGTDPSSILLD